MSRLTLTHSLVLTAATLTICLAPIRAHAAGCQASHDAYSKMLKASPRLVQKDTGAVNVTKVLGDITAGGDWEETCKYLRDEAVDGEAAVVYSDNFTGKAAKTEGQIWISKKTGLVLRQEGDVDLGAKGKGHQSIRFDYSEK
jgi:hypothetical protein